MKPALGTFACAFAALALAGCGKPPPRQPANTAAAEEDASPNANVDLSKVELPPPVVGSIAFRCSDGAELFVDLLEDKDSVLVKDKAGDIPVKLTREGGSGPFTAEGRSLSGTGDVVTYSSKERPGQRCGR